MILKVSAQFEIDDVSFDRDNVIAKLEKDLYDITEFLEENDDILNMTEIDVLSTEVSVSKTNEQNVFDVKVAVDFDNNSSDFVDADVDDEDDYYEALNEHDQEVYEVIESEVDQFMSHFLGDYEDSNGNQFEVVELEVQSVQVSQY